MSVPISSASLYPLGGFGPPKDRRGSARGSLGLPAGTEVFSADNHISLAHDIFFERFPASLEDRATRVWYQGGAYQLGRKGKSFLPGDFSHVLTQYDPLDGSGSANWWEPAGAHRAGDVRLQLLEQGRHEREAETAKYALACARNRPTDTIFMQQVFFEIMKQQQGEYLGSLLSGFFESLGGHIHADDDELMLDKAFDNGLNESVEDNDSRFPPEFRLSKSAREERE